LSRKEFEIFLQPNFRSCITNFEEKPLYDRYDHGEIKEEQSILLITMILLHILKKMSQMLIYIVVIQFLQRKALKKKKFDLW